VSLSGGVEELVELLLVRALGPFDAAVELRGARRQDEEQKALIAAGGLELGAAVDLDRAHRKGRPGQQVLEEARRGHRGGAAVHAKDVYLNVANCEAYAYPHGLSTVAVAKTGHRPARHD
jgi:hypothetical protein